MKTVTAIVLALVIVGLVLYDLVAYLYFGYDSTLTYAIRSTVQRYPWQGLILAFVGGILFSHLLAWDQ